MTTEDPSPERFADPISFRFDAEFRLRIAGFSGVVTDDDLMGAYRALVAAPDYDVGADDLVDLRQVTHLGVTAQGLRQLMGLFTEIDHLGVATRLAIVAPNDEVYGVSRMYQMLRGDGVPEEISVFRELEAALTWLADGRAKRGHSSNGNAA